MHPFRHSLHRPGTGPAPQPDPRPAREKVEPGQAPGPHSHRRLGAVGTLAWVVASVLLAATVASSQATPNTYVVTSQAFNGPGSLAQAIADANSHTGRDRIEFRVPTSCRAWCSARIPTGTPSTSSPRC